MKRSDARAKLCPWLVRPGVDATCQAELCIYWRNTVSTIGGLSLEVPPVEGPEPGEDPTGACTLTHVQQVMVPVSAPPAMPPGLLR